MTQTWGKCGVCGADGWASCCPSCAAKVRAKSVVHGLEVTVDEPARAGDMIEVRFPGGTCHGSTRDEALFWAGYWYGRKKLGEAVGLLVQKGGRADVVVEE